MQAMGAAMTQDEFHALIESVRDGIVAVGIFRVVGIDHLGRKCYVLTAAAKGRHVRRKQVNAHSTASNHCALKVFHAIRKLRPRVLRFFEY